MATINLTYDCEVGLQSPAAMVPKIAAVDILDGTLEMLGMEVFSDNTAVAGTLVQREIVLTVLPDGEARFPTEESKKYATRNLFRAVIAGGATVRVTAADPVVNP